MSKVRRVLDPSSEFSPFRTAWGIIQRECERANGTIHQQIRGGGVHVLCEDWDNLIILDACRYDDFIDHTRFDSVQSRRSLGSDSREFTVRNFGGEHHDIVYVTANPYTASHSGEFHHIISLLGDGWDEEYNTVLPGTVASAAREAVSRYSNKRIIAHFMQPHLPAIGPMRHELPGKDFHPAESANADLPEVLPTWSSLRFGINNVTVKKVRRAYLENLERVLDIAEPLAKELPGKTVITADHGELFGERLWPIPVRGWMHPSGVRIEELVKVPWVEVDGERRDIVSEPPTGGEVAEVTESQLRALGYH